MKVVRAKQQRQKKRRVQSVGNTTKTQQKHPFATYTIV